MLQEMGGGGGFRKLLTTLFMINRYIKLTHWSYIHSLYAVINLRVVLYLFDPLSK